MDTYVFRNLRNENQICIICTWAPRTAYDLFEHELGQEVKHVQTFNITGATVNEQGENYDDFHEYFEKKYSKKTIILQEESYRARWYECDNADELIEKIQDIFNDFINLKQPTKEEKNQDQFAQATLF